ncbi:MAG: hypothetical protein R3B13_18530 [Polyangiaceae bacterium]
MYEKLDNDKIVRTIEQLERRIDERFPGASLVGVAQGLLAIAKTTIERTNALQRPHVWLRTGIALLLGSAVVVLLLMAPELRLNYQIRAFTELIQTVEALLGSLFFLGTGVAFLVTLESRMKRKVALGLVHQLRALAHIVDMHQLTKDPAELLAGGPATASSPKRTMTDFQLLRYLDYCCELLSLVSKVGALTVQGYVDPVVLGAVDEVENLTTGLSSKIWQKIALLKQAQTQNDAQERREASWRRRTLTNKRHGRLT